MMYKFMWIINVLFFSFCLCLENRPDPRIVGGFPADIANIPYIVSIQLFGIHHCGGSIINNHTILTAAHCLAGVSPRLLKVKVGGISRYRKDGEIFSVADLHTHEKYNAKTMDYDIGVLRLTKNLTLSNKVRVIPINPNRVADGTYATIAGWGFKSMNGPPSDSLRYARVPIVNQTACRKFLGKGVTDRMLCAGYLRGGTDSCQMDSGGPLSVREQLVGIVSWGVGCALADKPGVYSRLDALYPWLNKLLNKLN
ncbi:trypsin-1 [Drosophila ficusphila]|uniref:trypsin-1 n=1 Tax=Drosophila ficusphila TaxID=30025 RepID=UPI001C8A7B91|nr:trypsin-1 [Drosophila ficusphila]